MMVWQIFVEKSIRVEFEKPPNKDCYLCGAIYLVVTYFINIMLEQ